MLRSASPVPCRLCLLLIYNAYPDHDKVQNWERRCGCVAHLCGCYKTMTSKVEDRSVQRELLCLWQEQRLVPATCEAQQMGCRRVCKPVFAEAARSLSFPSKNNSVSAFYVRLSYRA